MLVGGIEVGKKGSQRRVVLEVTELGGHVEECGERLSPPSSPGLRAGSQLDIEADRQDHLVEKVEQRLAEMPAEVTDLLGQRGKPVACLGRVGQLSRRGQRISQGYHLCGIDAADGLL